MKIIKKLNSRGFGHIELVFVLIVIAALVLTGVYIAKHHKSHAQSITTLASMSGGSPELSIQACQTYANTLYGGIYKVNIIFIKPYKWQSTGYGYTVYQGSSSTVRSTKSGTTYGFWGVATGLTAGASANAHDRITVWSDTSQGNISKTNIDPSTLASCDGSTTTTTTTTTATTNTGGSMSAPAGYSASQKLWDDQFSGTSLDTSRWNAFLGPGSRWGDRGTLASPYSGGNTPLSTDVALYSPSQVSVNNGLTLTATRGGGPYASLGYQWQSGVITTKNPLPSTGWYVQVKAQMPDTSQGMWPAIWALPASSAQELDGYEGGWPGSSPNQQGHSDTFASSGEIQRVWGTPGGANLSTGYHIYGFKYTPGSGMSFYVDGTQVYSSSTNLSQQAYYLFIQLQVAGGNTAGWHTVTNGSTPTSSMKVAEVQVYN